MMSVSILRIFAIIIMLSSCRQVNIDNHVQDGKVGEMYLHVKSLQSITVEKQRPNSVPELHQVQLHAVEILNTTLSTEKHSLLEFHRMIFSYQPRNSAELSTCILGKVALGKKTTITPGNNCYTANSLKAYVHQFAHTCALASDGKFISLSSSESNIEKDFGCEFRVVTSDSSDTATESTNNASKSSMQIPASCFAENGCLPADYPGHSKDLLGNYLRNNSGSSGISAVVDILKKNAITCQKQGKKIVTTNRQFYCQCGDSESINSEGKILPCLDRKHHFFSVFIQ